METRYTVKINKGQYLSEVDPFKSNSIPTDTIIHKTITGCGVTTLEIKAKRHSIIILPNVPVIRGKVVKHNASDNKKHLILGVFKGIEVTDIERYIESDNVYKKILTTPEGFVSKVLAAFKNDLQSFYKDYFLLFDECERIITDVDYRGKIAAPLKYFFQFDNKALVSATTLPFSDERFKNFKHITIEPNYDYGKPIKLIETNNVLQSFKRLIVELNGERVAVFLNSTDAIYSLIDAAGIKDESFVFCGNESVNKLRTNGFRNASDIFDIADTTRYSFFTSRFFSGVDIEVDYQPDIVLVTDVYFAEHSILDPMTEVIQIAGRYRNGIKSLTHISNFNPLLSSKSEEESRYYLNGCFDTYKGFVNSYNETQHPGSKDTLKFAIENSTAHHFFDEDELNTFMVDNFLSYERVKGYYQVSSNLKEAYEKLRGHFKLTFKSEVYALGDLERMRRTNITGKNHLKEIAKQIDKLTPKVGEYIFEPEGERDYLRSKYPLIYQAYQLIGLNGLEETGYNDKAIKKAIDGAEREAKYNSCAIDVYETFIENNCYPKSEIIEKLGPLLATRGVNKVVPKDILRYFKGYETTRKKVKVICLTERTS